MLTDSTADLAVALMLALMRRLAEGEAAVRGGGWRMWRPDWLLGRDLHSSTVCIVGGGPDRERRGWRVEGFGVR